jgi:hypothetical protein
MISCHTPRMIRLACILVPMLFLFSGCDSGQPGALSLGEYESDLGEAIVRHFIKTLPNPAPEIPKSYCVVKGRDLEPTRTEFVKRMDDLRLRFISANVLLVTEPGPVVVDPETRLSPLFIQLASIQQSGMDRWKVALGWSYKKLYEKFTCEVRKTESGYQIESLSRVEGNYEAPPPAAK